MKKESMRKYTLLGLVLIAASAVTAAVLPKNEDVKKAIGRLVDSNNGNPALTCTAGSGLECTHTITIAGNGPNGMASRTSEGGALTSSITTTNNINKERTRSSVNGLTVNNIHTSVSPD